MTWAPLSGHSQRIHSQRAHPHRLTLHCSLTRGRSAAGRCHSGRSSTPTRAYLSFRCASTFTPVQPCTRLSSSKAHYVHAYACIRALLIFSKCAPSSQRLVDGPAGALRCAYGVITCPCFIYIPLLAAHSKLKSEKATTLSAARLVSQRLPKCIVDLHTPRRKVWNQGAPPRALPPRREAEQSAVYGTSGVRPSTVLSLIGCPTAGGKARSSTCSTVDTVKTGVRTRMY